MKLQQGQTWRIKSGDYVRIVRLDRLSVEYKKMLRPDTKDGRHIDATKKEFCRLIKGGELIDMKTVSENPAPRSAPKPRPKRDGRVR